MSWSPACAVHARPLVWALCCCRGCEPVFLMLHALLQQRRPQLRAALAATHLLAVCLEALFDLQSDEIAAATHVVRAPNDSTASTCNNRMTGTCYCAKVAVVACNRLAVRGHACDRAPTGAALAVLQLDTRRSHNANAVCRAAALGDFCMHACVCVAWHFSLLGVWGCRGLSLYMYRVGFVWAVLLAVMLSVDCCGAAGKALTA